MHKKWLIRLIAFFCAALGVFLLSYVFFPILSYELSSQSRFASFLSPIPEGYILASESENLDYTKASSWFSGGAKSEDFKRREVFYYTISISSLGLDSVTVAVGGEDLSKYLIQYPGTAQPGKTGNAVIFGHSILPQFFNPKEYLSIFSTLHTLKKGHEIFVKFDGILFKYRVEDKFEVLPTDLQILEQNMSDSFLTLVTCVPPGDPRRPRRLIVRARIVPLEKINAASWN